MPERYKLPERDRSKGFYAEFVLYEKGDYLVAKDGWMNAPGRGDEIMAIVQEKLHQLATDKGRKIVHRFEAASLQGKKLVQRHSDYVWKERSYDGNSIYEKEYMP